MTVPRPALHLSAITTPHGTPAAAFTRALASRERWAAAVTDLQGRGVTGLRCPDCGFVHSIARVQQSCNAHTNDGVCDSTARLIEVQPTLSLSNGLGGTAQVRYSVNGRAL